jgi:hypothetical protein
MPREKLQNLVIPKPMPKDVTLSLTRSFDDPRETVDTYWFTDTIRETFERILKLAAQGRGQGFWIEAEYGAGKTHFLATLACLLAHTEDEALWNLVKDETVRTYRRRLASQRLFPVVLSLKGQSGVDEWSGRTLLGVLEREGLGEALKRADLRDQIQITSTDELLAWFEERESGLRAAIERYVETETGFPPTDYATGYGRQALADVIRRYCDANQIRPRTSASVRDRLVNIFNQLTSPGLVGKGAEPYTGLLVVIDEWEFWERLHPVGSSEAAHDEEVLETLSFVMAKDLGLPVLTLVGSQTTVPAKLRGGQEGDRFISVALLRGAGEREYDLIVSHRVRELDPERAPEINQYYDYYASHFESVKELNRQAFFDIFPFQPRCFEVVRRVTARELPTARSGIYILHQTLTDKDALRRDTLLTVSELLNSQHLQEALSASVYKKATEAYRAALEALPSLDLDDDERPLAEKILKTLFLWHLTYLEVPQPMSIADLVEATLTSSDYLRNEDQVALVLDVMSILPQVDFKDGSVSFVVTGIGEDPFFVKFDRFKRQITDRHEMQQAWQDSLFLSPMETGGEQSLFGQFESDKLKSVKVTHRRIEYPGELVVATRWRGEYGQTLAADDKHFRVVILTQIEQQIEPSDLQDPRITVLIPGPLTADVYEAAGEYLATQAMTEAYRTRVGKEADDVRQELQGRKRPEVIRNLLASHQRVYRAGRVITQRDLGIEAAEVFSQPNNDRRLELVVDKLLTSAYQRLPVAYGQLRKDFSANDAPKVFDGFFRPNPSKADESAVVNFAVGLGLARAGKPKGFAPSEAAALKLIGEMLDEAGGGELPVWRIYERLSRPPYGLPYALITLYLLSFVRHSQDPVVNLHLKPDHRLSLRSGDPPPRDLLNRGNVVQLAWRSSMDRWFDLLAPTEDVWPQVVTFGRVIRDDLVVGVDTFEVEQQQTKLSEALTDLQARVQQTAHQLDLLCTAFGRSLVPEDEAALTRIEKVSQADVYQSFYDRLGETYTQPEALQEDMDVFQRLDKLAVATAEIQGVKTYLDQMERDALSPELGGEYRTIQAQVNLEMLAAQPHIWPSIQAQFEGFRQRYRSIYQIHHRDTYKTIRQIQDDLSDAPRKLNALQLLNGVKDLGHPLGQDLADRYARLQGDLQICDVGVNDVKVEMSPVCASCRLSVSHRAPVDEAQRLQRDMDDALGEQLRRLKTEAIRKVLAESGADRMEQLIKAVELSNLDGLVDVLDADLVAFIAETLEMQGVGTVPTNVLQRLADKYPTLEEEDVPTFIQELKALLAEVFASARAEHPDKQTIRISLK